MFEKIKEKFKEIRKKVCAKIVELLDRFSVWLEEGNHERAILNTAIVLTTTAVVALTCYAIFPAAFMANPAIKISIPASVLVAATRKAGGTCG